MRGEYLFLMLMLSLSRKSSESEVRVDLNADFVLGGEEGLLFRKQ